MLQINHNFFQLLNLPESFELNLDILAETYRELQLEVHPDKFARGDEQEKMRAVQMTSFLNEAYGTLKSPLRRAGHLLKLKGCDVEQVSQSDLDMDLLMEQMQLREALAALPKDESALPELERLKIEVSEKLLDRQTHFAADIESNRLTEAKKIFHEMQFLHKLLSEIDSGEEQRLDY